MKLVRYGAAGAEKPGLIDANGAIRDLSGVLKDIDGSALSDESLARIKALDPDSLPKVDGNPRFGAPVANVGKFIAIGLNYSDHAKESNMPIPKEPVVFNKATSCIMGPNDTVVLPAASPLALTSSPLLEARLTLLKLKVAGSYSIRLSVRVRNSVARTTWRPSAHCTPASTERADSGRSAGLPENGS
jgi:hypothetical protein